MLRIYRTATSLADKQKFRKMDNKVGAKKAAVDLGVCAVVLAVH
jgi:hypothetical protein